MKYTPTFYYDNETIEDVIFDVKTYFNININKKQACKIIRRNLRLFGEAFLWDKQIDNIDLKEYL